MSLLPQRKKSPAEIAQLRASLGIPSSPPGVHPASPPHGAPASAGFATHPSAEDAPTTAAPTPLPAPAGPKQVRSLKRSEQVPILPVATVQPAEEPVVHVLSLKPVRSLRKSEQLATPAIPRQATPPADSSLPFQRHSDDEIERIRRREVLAMLSPVVNPKLVPAHPAWIGLGYVAVLATAMSAAFPLPSTTPADLYWIRCCGHALAFDPRQFAIPACCAAVALLVAAGIVLFRPFSRHHAAFISVTTLFVIIFSAIHYFPQLRHGT